MLLDLRDEEEETSGCVVKGLGGERASTDCWMTSTWTCEFPFSWMSSPEIIDLCSDDEAESENIKDVKPIILSAPSKGTAGNSSIIASVHFPDDKFQPITTFRNSYHQPCRQFWKSGDYELDHTIESLPRNGKNRLRIHPKFLHSNATSHKWAFGAIAELLDNAVDEVQNGATFVIIDKFSDSRNGDPALLIQDDGGGMDPESLRRCMSFGFSDKQSGSTIGQCTESSNLNFKSGFPNCKYPDYNSKSTRSIGLLSYTFLRQTGCDDIVVPVVDYELNSLTDAMVHQLRVDEKQFASNLTTLLKWSPFHTEAQLLKQFDDVGPHGTKIIVFNLWHNDAGVMELDFHTDSEDILIAGGQAEQTKVKKSNTESEISQINVASRYQYSLRVYSSILYLKLPQNFKILLRGLEVEPHHIIKDLLYIECIRYRPQVDINKEVIVDTTLGFMKGAPSINVQGFNVYHKNRLILPFWKVAHNSYGKGRGVVGVLEANFIKPTHDKQDFERSSLYQKLELRLKDMTYEYWDLYCHLVGYQNKKLPHRTSDLQSPSTSSYRALQQLKMNRIDSIAMVTAAPSVVALSAPTFSPPVLPQKRKREIQRSVTESFAPDAAKGGSLGNHKAKEERISIIKQMQISDALKLENKKLHEQRSEYEETEKELLLKEAKLRSELQEAADLYARLLAEARMTSEVKTENFDG
ncbi:protein MICRORCHIDIA 6-like isoform X2 [Phalaenopsis equestris]|uniref:protein MICRORCHIDIA 6-like isoform X2 n=1 Tax=Phalaenopsis equestris TaxID=78828 RepID=UPI0009E4A241|nr:protein MICRORCHIDIA 6-like isoform X2 [Phalaenopsis equestris]